MAADADHRPVPAVRRRGAAATPAPRPAGRTLTSDHERELVRRAAGDDLAAFAALVRLHEAELRRYTRRLAGDGGDDVAQDALLAAFRNIGQWRGEGSFAGWLKAIASRRFLDERRSAAARSAREHGSADPCPPSAPDRRLDIDRALAALPPRERAACLLTFAYGHSHAEAAAMLAIPLGTLKTLVARGRAALLTRLEDHL